MIENDKEIAKSTYSEGSMDGELLTSYIKNEPAIIGKQYEERLAVKDAGTIDIYTKVSIFKEWKNEDGSINRSLNPSMIDINILGNGWIEDEIKRTSSSIVLYYTKPLKSGETSPNFVDSITINPLIKQNVTFGTNNNVITTQREYEGAHMEIRCQVDAVQTHQADYAIWSAWGREVEIAQDRNINFKIENQLVTIFSPICKMLNTNTNKKVNNANKKINNANKKINNVVLQLM